MAGSVIGGKKAAQTNKDKYGSDYYARIGKRGGSTKPVGLRGFAANRELASEVGRKGGLISKRGKALNG